MPEVGFVVAPPNALVERSRLFDAVGRLYDVEFVPEGTAAPRVAGRIEFGDANRRAGRDRIPTLTLVQTRRAPGDVLLHDAEEVPRPFRGRTIRDSAVGVLPADIAGRSHSVLAQSGGGHPVWVRLSAFHFAAPAATELRANETLRSRFRPGQFSDLLPLLAFIRRYSEADWIGPQGSASFVIDDPNLHAVRYGFVHYRHLARHAEANRYHVAFATIPLDLWWASKKAVRIFRESSDVLSLLVHGNDHVYHELDRTQSDRERTAFLAQALRRVDRFERRYGLPVARVMAPPHGACSRATAEALLPTGFEALCVSRTHPWCEVEPTDDALLGLAVSASRRWRVSPPTQAPHSERPRRVTVQSIPGSAADRLRSPRRSRRGPLDLGGDRGLRSRSRAREVVIARPDSQVEVFLTSRGVVPRRPTPDASGRGRS